MVASGRTEVPEDSFLSFFLRELLALKFGGDIVGLTHSNRLSGLTCGTDFMGCYISSLKEFSGPSQLFLPWVLSPSHEQRKGLGT